MGGGHYIAYVKSSSGFWYCMDDSDVRQVNIAHVLKQQAYLLFYVRCHDSARAAIDLADRAAAAAAAAAKAPLPFLATAGSDVAANMQSIAE